MNLLIITQKVDKNDSVLGFFHNWIEKFSCNYKKIIVIALEVGEYDLPDNVGVFSLGKEKGYSKFKYLINFYSLIIKKRKEYKAIFVHMNVEYVVLAGLLWKLLNKKVFLWYNHKLGSLKARLAVYLAYKIFYTSPFAFSAKYKKAEIMPVGIDMDLFKNNKEDCASEDILCLGRISPVKNIDLLIKAAILLDKENIDFRINIYGDAPSQDQDYVEKIKDKAQRLVEKKKIRFYPAVPNYEAPEIYNKHYLYINLTKSGSFDKTILEAMSCGNLVLICNESFGEDFPKQFLFKQGDVDDLKEKIKKLLSSDDNIKSDKLRNLVIEKHSLDLLDKKIYKQIKTLFNE